MSTKHPQLLPRPESNPDELVATTPVLTRYLEAYLSQPEPSVHEAPVTQQSLMRGLPTSSPAPQQKSEPVRYEGRKGYREPTRMPTDPPDTQSMPPKDAVSQQEDFHGSLLDITNDGGVPQRVQEEQDRDPKQAEDPEDPEDYAGTKKTSI